MVSAACGKPPDEPLIFKHQLYAISRQQAITSLMPTIVNLGFTIKEVNYNSNLD